MSHEPINYQIIMYQSPPLSLTSIPMHNISITLFVDLGSFKKTPGQLAKKPRRGTWGNRGGFFGRPGTCGSFPVANRSPVYTYSSKSE